MYQTGTHGSVGGRLANQSSASYPIVQRKGICRKDHPRMCEREPAVSGTGAERCTGVSP